MSAGDCQLVVRAAQRRQLPRLHAWLLLPRIWDLQRHLGVYRRLLLSWRRRRGHRVRLGSMNCFVVWFQRDGDLHKYTSPFQSCAAIRFLLSPSKTLNATNTNITLLSVCCFMGPISYTVFVRQDATVRRDRSTQESAWLALTKMNPGRRLACNAQKGE